MIMSSLGSPSVSAKCLTSSSFRTSPICHLASLKADKHVDELRNGT